MRQQNNEMYDGVYFSYGSTVSKGCFVKWNAWSHVCTSKLESVVLHSTKQNRICSRFCTPCSKVVLKANIALPMGNYGATGGHLLALTAKFQKDQHGLRLRDINHKDKQNFQAVVNITSAGHLLSKIPEADATKCYVELIQCVWIAIWIRVYTHVPELKRYGV